jgi:hypothetical protein
MMIAQVRTRRVNAPALHEKHANASERRAYASAYVVLAERAERHNKRPHAGTKEPPPRAWLIGQIAYLSTF